jgi:L-ascorbate metabolism protein UlaG (beta-lactamase superfamily)
MSHKFFSFTHPHRHKNRFYNHPHERANSRIFPSLAIAFEACWNSIKRTTCNKEYWYAPADPIERSKKLAITWIGHSTFLIQAAGINIITDPIFGGMPFFKRQIAPGISIESVPHVDYVLISHNHRDHMDEAALTYFKKHPQVTFLVPLGDKAWFEKRGFVGVREYSWWERDAFIHESGSVTFSFLPAHHWSQRSLFDYNKSLWGSWMIEVDGHTLYFAGDTAYSNHFSAISKEFLKIDYALMPIGPCEPRKWMQLTHVSAEEAGQGFLDLDAHHFIPMHWATFKFGVDEHEGPYERLHAWWIAQKLEGVKNLIVCKIGERYMQTADHAASEIIIPNQTEQIL